MHDARSQPNRETAIPLAIVRDITSVIHVTYMACDVTGTTAPFCPSALAPRGCDPGPLARRLRWPRRGPFDASQQVRGWSREDLLWDELQPHKHRIPIASDCVLSRCHTAVYFPMVYSALKMTINVGDDKGGRAQVCIIVWLRGWVENEGVARGYVFNLFPVCSFQYRREVSLSRNRVFEMPSTL